MTYLFKTAAMCAISVGALGLSTIGSSATIVGPGLEQVVGVFSAPVYTGFIYNVPAVGQKSFYDNSASAPSTTSFGGDTLTWGTDTGVTIGTDYSSLTFTGAYVPDADQSVPLQLGTITYTNGTSALNSIIFGATLSFYLNGILLGSDQVIITTTSNQNGGVDLTQPEAQTDADYVNICGNGSNICGTAIQAYENTQGVGGVAFSTPVVAALNGTYTIDPGVDLTSVDYQSGDGVVGDRDAQSAIPEPSTWAMLLAGFGALGLIGYRKTRKSAAIA